MLKNKMLILKVFVNHEEIDEIWVHNTGYFHDDGYYLYEVAKPKGIERKFPHKRARGYKPLVTQVLKHLTEVEECGV